MKPRNVRKLQLLEAELNQENFLKIDIHLPVLTEQKLKNSRHHETAIEVFESLGGHEFSIPKDPSYHLEYNGLLIQLDDELHFNRYRKMTLESGIYNDYKGFKLMDYRLNSRSMEKECIKSGLSNNNWTNYEAEKTFGKSEEPGDLSLERNGSAAWKMRAWTDFLQDLSGLVLGFKVLRVSNYDKLMVGGQIQTIGKLLASGNQNNYRLIAKALVRRIINLKGS